MENLIFLNIVYALFTLFAIYPPNEVVSFGFSIPTLFASVLGSEQMHLIHYHMIRIMITLVIHSLLPLGYFIFIGTFSQESNLFDLANLSLAWKAYLSVSLLFAVGVITYVYYWKMDNFNEHPISIKLRKFSSMPTLRISWKEVASEINTEFRRVEKFTSGSLFNQTFVTDNWLIKVGLYSVNCCRLQNLDLILTHTNEFNLNQDGNLSAQYLNILAKPTVNNGSFYIRLNSLEYKEFNEKLHRPVIEACDIVIKQSLPEQFLDAFREQINQNEMYQLRQEVKHK